MTSTGECNRKRTLPGDFAFYNPSRPSIHLRSNIVSSAFASGLGQKTALQAHHSCVNALAVSKDGRWLASGGDDMRVLVWDTNDDGDGRGAAGEPRGCYRGARSNLFSLAWACDGGKLFAAGNDAAILCYDIETSSSTWPTPLSDGVPPTDAWLDHDDAIMGLSCHPSNPALFLSASSDGTIRLFDVRQPGGGVGLLADTHAMDGVEYHPTSSDLFAYSGEDGHVGLVDGRMAWSDGASSTARAANGVDHILSEIAVVQFDTTVSRRPSPRRAIQTASPTVSSITFSPSGSLICATLSGHLPTLYELSSPSPLATFSSPAPLRTLPILGEVVEDLPFSFPRGYRNTCTTKHGSFGGGAGAAPGAGLYYAAGSDNFKTYVWEVPDLESLREQRKEVDSDGLVGIGFRTKSQPHEFTLPAPISTPSSILTGHRSIVNSAIFHPHLPILYTSGVEKPIIRHSAVSPSSALLASSSSSTSSPPSWSFTPRRPWSHEHNPDDHPPDDLSNPLESALKPGESVEEREIRLRGEDLQMLEHFDGLVEEEREETLWDESGMRFARGGESSSDEEEEEEDEDEDGDEVTAVWARIRRRMRQREDRAQDGDEAEERIAAEGDEGTTRRILRSIYALEGAEATSSGEEEEDSGDGTSELEGE